MDKKLLALLVCPLCKGKLLYQDQKKELICKFDRIAYPIKDDVPILLEKEGRLLTTQEYERLDA